MRKIDSERWKLRKSLRHSYTNDSYKDRNLWRHLEAHQINNIVEALEDTPQQLYDTLRLRHQEQPKQKKKFQRLAMKTQACELGSRDGRYDLMRRKIEMKTRQLEDRRRQLARTRLQPIVKASFPFGYYVRESTGSRSGKKIGSFRRQPRAM